MNSSTVSIRKPIIFIIASLATLFMPGIGDIRWIGFITFLYIGIPWYILSVKDKIEHKISNDQDSGRRFKVYSLTLLTFGLISAVLGVAIDLFILYQVYLDSSLASIGSVILRLLIGVPFFWIWRIFNIPIFRFNKQRQMTSFGR